MQVAISASVGRGGVNQRTDVLVVQRLLNENVELLSPLGRLELGGSADESTMLAIVEFQRRVVKSSRPDGRVDPGGRTWRALAGRYLEFVPLPSPGTGYYSYAGASRQWGTRATIGSLQAAVEAFFLAEEVLVGIGDISLKGGGTMAPHSSHKHGRDADLRPLRKDAAHAPVSIGETAYSERATRTLVAILRRDPNVKSILFNDDDIEGVKHWAGHDNHLHVSFHV